MSFQYFAQFITPFISIALALGAIAVAIPTLIYTIKAVKTTEKINKQQVKREEDNYLLFSIVSPYNAIETDIMLIAQGTYDRSFNKDDFDKQVLLDISKAKSYALMARNAALFDYLDGLVTGKATEQMGPLIEEYFTEREKIKVPNNLVKGTSFCRSDKLKAIGAGLRTRFLQRARDLRDQTIIAIESKLK